MNAGDGTFQPAKNFRAGDAPYSVAIGDFNNDGRPDIAAANQLVAKVSVLLNKGSNRFHSAGRYPAGGVPWAIDIHDFNGDGHVDVAVANYAEFGSVGILLNAADWGRASDDDGRPAGWAGDIPPSEASDSISDIHGNDTELFAHFDRAPVRPSVEEKNAESPTPRIVPVPRRIANKRSLVRSPFDVPPQAPL